MTWHIAVSAAVSSLLLVSCGDGVASANFEGLVDLNADTAHYSFTGKMIAVRDAYGRVTWSGSGHSMDSRGGETSSMVDGEHSLLDFLIAKDHVRGRPCTMRKCARSDSASL
jgi:hypothetical protein